MKKHPLQNRTNVQIKGGGGGKGLLNNVQKNCTFLTGGHPLLVKALTAILFSYLVEELVSVIKLLVYENDRCPALIGRA